MEAEGEGLGDKLSETLGLRLSLIEGLGEIDKLTETDGEREGLREGEGIEITPQ